ALHGYHDVHLCFPKGSSITGQAVSLQFNQSPTNAVNWKVPILPFLEQSAFYDNIDFTRTLLATSMSSGSTSKNETALKNVIVPAYDCPSDSVEQFATRTNCHNENCRTQTSCYVGISGAVPDPAGRTDVYILPSSGYMANSGMLCLNQWKNISDDLDGTSNSLMVGEQSGLIGKETPAFCRSNYAGHWAGVWTRLTDTDSGNYYNVQHLIGMGYTSGKGNIYATGITTVYYMINYQTRSSYTYDTYHSCTVLNSFHKGGVNGLIADGAVRFFPDTISMDLLRRWASANDGLSVE
ncbi:MAG: DUF1559 domain-containing protein, partial [Planctomycetia bacterium]|nr:DUF1559 domain-containing protein [Planctomycetia bacterium]